MDSESNSFDFVNTGNELVNGLISLRLSEPEGEEYYYSIFQDLFKPIKILGQGGFGCVFEAEKYVERKVFIWKGAVKRIAYKKGGNAVDEALKEVQALLKLDHKGVVKFRDAWTEKPPKGWQNCADADLLNELNTNERFTYKVDSDFLYYQMELCKSTLVDWLVANSDRDLNKIKDIFKDLVIAVGYIHSQKFIHRDLKPSNILFAEDGTLKICDLGIATDRVMMSVDEGGLEIPIERTFERGTKYMDVFDNYRLARPNTLLQHIPEAEKFVAWLTNPIDTERPDVDAVRYEDFLKSDQYKRDIKHMHKNRMARMRTLAMGIKYKNIKRQEAEMAAKNSAEQAQTK